MNLKMTIFLTTLSRILRVINISPKLSLEKYGSDGEQQANKFEDKREEFKLP
jgi:hypothetical protein